MIEKLVSQLSVRDQRRVVLEEQRIVLPLTPSSAAFGPLEESLGRGATLDHDKTLFILARSS